MEKEVLYSSETIDAYWLATEGVLHVIYKGELVPESTLIAYKIGGDLLVKHGIDNFKGLIGDFREVSKFPNANIVTTRSQSNRVNSQYDLSKLGIALVVKNLMQETFVKITAKTSNTEHRSKVVKSVEAGLEFIREYRKGTSDVV